MTVQKPAGWVVMVRTQRLGGGEAMTIGYAVGADTKDRASELVRTKLDLAPDEEIGIVAPLQPSTVAALGLTEGLVLMI